MQPDFSTAPRPKRLVPWDGVLLGVAVVVFASAGALAWRAKEDAGEAATRLSDVRRQIERESSRLRALTAAASAGARSAAAEEAPPARIVAAIAGALPPDARLERLSIDYAHGVAIEMLVQARSAGAWDRLLDRLERSADFKEVEPGPETREAEMRTTVRARWAGAAP